ncbi:MAG: N-methyl-D-aspartate receptor NMDAR2C subunit [Burkholderiales bacterium]
MPDSTSPDLPAELRARLTAMYGAPERYYHALGHIEALHRWLAHWQRLAREPRFIDAAIWFHDAIYDPHRDDNEPRSAELARTELTTIGWSTDAVERVAALVLATRHHQADADDADAWLFLDLDLSVLGQSPAQYAAYSAGVRAEYAWVAAARFRTGRAAVLRSFLDRVAIYRTPELHAAWEAAARANVAAELSSLV